MSNSRHLSWRQPLSEAIFISIFILGLFYYWFGMANRYSIFLYGHTAVGIPYAQPFDEMTSSRYWMSGLVAAGAVLVLYTAINWLQGRLAVWRRKSFAPSKWWIVWTISSIPLSLGIPIITMTMNWPTLPARLAAKCVVATLLGLIIALLPGKWAAERPVALLWLVADGVGLMPILLLLRVVELPGRGLSVNNTTVWLIAIGGLLAGLMWLAGMSVVRIWRQQESPRASALLLTGVGLSYVIMPLVHHLLATPPAHRYISTASNFFAFNLNMQLLVILVASGLAIAVTNGRSWLRHKIETLGLTYFNR